MTGFATVAAFDSTLAALTEPDLRAADAARRRQGILTKPPGSLGRLEDIAIFLAAWQGRAIPALDRPTAIVFAANHGVAARGVSAFPSEVTAQMVANFEAGGAAINALAGVAGTALKVVPIALDTPTADFTLEPAMDVDECLEALSIGAQAIPADCDLLLLGEMGIANSTSAAALCLSSLGGDAIDWVGPGTGVRGEAFGAKRMAVAQAATRHASARTPFERLRRLGGREIAAIAGAVLAARQRGIPVVLDGYICTAALAPLAAAAPDIVGHCLASHCSAEPGHQRLLNHLGLDPLLNLEMRLGEASGAAVATLVIRAAVAAHAQMATFTEAGVATAG